MSDRPSFPRPADSQTATTPDGRYIVVRGRLWRAADPALSSDVRQRLVDELMSARRAVRLALKNGDEAALRMAREQVQSAKEALGERGPTWWNDDAPDLNRKMIRNTPYAQWWDRQAPPCGRSHVEAG